MTSTKIKKQETSLQQELLKLKSKFPDWNFYYELETKYQEDNFCWFRLFPNFNVLASL